LHGGRVWAESAEGGPTAVHVFLPSAETPEWQAPARHHNGKGAEAEPLTTKALLARADAVTGS
jgi:hypothetical protein